MRTFFGRRSRSPALDALDGLFIAQRHLYRLVRTEVLANTGLTVETAEIIFELYLSADGRTASGAADENGFVAMQDLLKALGYTAGLLSRRVGWLARQRWVESKKVAARPGYGMHGNCQKIRITAAGKKFVAPIYAKYVSFATRLTAEIPVPDLNGCARVSRELVPGGDPGELRRETPLEAPATKPEPITTPPEPIPAKHFPEPDDEFID